MTDLAFTPAAELAARIARREVSPVEIVDDLLARIERSQPVINAFITVCAEAAPAAAREAETAVMRGAAWGRSRRAVRGQGSGQHRRGEHNLWLGGARRQRAGGGFGRRWRG